VRTARLWKRLLGVESAVIEEVFLEGVGLETVFVARVHPQAKERSRRGRCKRRSPLYDRGDGPRRWRTLDLGHTKAYLEADVPRVTCSEHGVCSAAVPWARHGTRPGCRLRLSSCRGGSPGTSIERSAVVGGIGRHVVRVERECVATDCGAALTTDGGGSWPDGTGIGAGTAVGGSKCRATE
jgi:zinc-finger of transposase IS204/IS1001/IS1096/IS1165